MRKIFRFLLIAFLFTGCSATVESRLDSVRNNYMTGTPDTNFEEKNNLDLLITADALFHHDDISNADKAYEIFNKKNPDIANNKSMLREAAALVGGANVNDYKPYMMDGLFVSYYQLWAALLDGRYNDARVIINQSYARQQDMSRAYQDLIESNQTKINKNSEVYNTIKNENSVWTAYRDIMNPALMYLSGIYFLGVGEFSDAKTYLKRANGMAPENEFIIQDLKLAENNKKPENTVWVFIEDSFAPKLTEKRISVPVASKNGVTTVTIAISEPQCLNEYIKFDKAKKLADVDAMFMTEYNEYRLNDALRAFTSAASRVVLQNSMYNSRSDAAPLLGIVSTLYSEFTNNAEVRTWATLPKTISVMRFINNKSGLIELKSSGSVIKRVTIPTIGNHLVYVRTTPNGFDIKTTKLN